VAEQTLASDGGDVVERSIEIGAPPEVVWRYWLEPALTARWMGTSATIDARPGGDVRIEYGNGAVMLGSIVELEPPARLVLMWGWEDPAELVRPGGSTVEVTFDPAPTGTLVRVRHSGLPETERPGHAEGWDYFLGRLAVATA
jgi:uncharacterized protein YndB with AHSA1/START domain